MAQMLTTTRDRAERLNRQDSPDRDRTTRTDRAVERAARDSYGRLLAYLAVRSQDIAACEDALAYAFCAALQHWPRTGVPRTPEAWLLSTARNRLKDHVRRTQTERDAVNTLLLLAEGRDSASCDHRLELLFACAHPAIAEADRTPLMLQVVLGLSAEAIARSFLVSESAMAKRLVRAKRKIKHARIPFELPSPDQWRPRVDAVLDAIYASYGRSWDHGVAPDPDVSDLCSEAIHLAELVTEALPDEPDALALRSLLLFCEARADARWDDERGFVALDAQDTRRWDHAKIEHAERLLRRAGERPTFGRYSLEAAIQSCHVATLRDGVDTKREVVTLYRALYRRCPTVGAWLGLVSATAEVDGPERALALLDQRPAAESHQPTWALRAELCRRLGRRKDAENAYRRAINATQDERVRSWLLRRQRKRE